MSVAQKQNASSALSVIEVPTPPNAMLYGCKRLRCRNRPRAPPQIWWVLSMPVLAGDSLSDWLRRRLRAINTISLPNHRVWISHHRCSIAAGSYWYLSEVVVAMFPRRSLAKEALLAWTIQRKIRAIAKNINQELLLLMLQKQLPWMGITNQQLYLGQMSAAQGRIQYIPVTNPLFNVFNWAKFFPFAENRIK